MCVWDKINGRIICVTFMSLLSFASMLWYTFGGKNQRVGGNISTLLKPSKTDIVSHLDSNQFLPTQANTINYNTSIIKNKHNHDHFNVYNTKSAPDLFLMDDTTMHSLHHFNWSNFQHINKRNMKLYIQNTESPLRNKNAKVNTTNKTKVTKLTYRTFRDFNNELICPLRLDINLSSNNTNFTTFISDRGKKIDRRIVEKSQRQLLTDIFNLQFPQNCKLDILNDNNQNGRFYIVQQPGSGIGLFAGFRFWAYYLYQALMSNRTLIFTGEWRGWTPPKYCGKKSRQCLVLPITNCSIVQHDSIHSNDEEILDDIDSDDYAAYGYAYRFENSSYYHLIEEAKKINQYVLITPKSLAEKQERKKDFIAQMKAKDKNFDINNYTFDPDGNYSDLAISELASDKLVVQTEGFHYLALKCYKMSLIRQVSARWPGITCVHLESILFNVFLRIQPSLLSIVNNMVYNSVAGIIDHVKPTETISSMIRWSDKCKNSDSKGHPEMICFELREYMHIARILKLLLKDQVKNIVVTSEDKHILLNATNETLYDKKDDLYNLTMIINKNDVMQGASMATRFSSEKNALTIMLSVLSTMKLQFLGKYYFHVPSSSWVRGVYQLKYYFHCQPFYMDQINALINNGFVKLSSKNITVDSDRKYDDDIKTEIDDDVNDKLVEVAKFSDLKQYEYDAECIEFKSPAFHSMGKNAFERYVFFSRNIAKTKNILYKNNDTQLINKAKTKHHNMTVKLDWTRFCKMHAGS